MFALFKNKVKVFFPDIFHLLSNIERGILQRLGSLCPFPIERWNAGDTLHRGCISSLAFLIHLWQHAVFWVSFSPFCPIGKNIGLFLKISAKLWILKKAATKSSFARVQCSVLCCDTLINAKYIPLIHSLKMIHSSILWYIHSGWMVSSGTQTHLHL